MGRRDRPSAQTERPQSERPLGEVVALVRGHLARGETKEAVEHAREAHARLDTPESLALAVEAYLARVANLKVRGLDVEARMLADSVRKRFPAACAPLDELFGVLGLDALVRPLADPNLAADARSRIEAAVQAEVTDLGALARVTSLPEDHALRRAALALDGALDAVTRGPVGEDALLLPEVSRKSPLAPWKALVRAIAAYHRHDDTGCVEALDAVAPRSAAARLVPEIRALLAGEGPSALRPPAGVAELRGALERLEAAFGGRKAKGMLRAIEATCELFSKAAPELLPRLRQLVSVRAVIADLPVERVLHAMGGPSLKDSRFWNLFARALERTGAIHHAAAAWAELLRISVLEGRFAEKSVEAGAILLRMAELLCQESLAGKVEAFKRAFQGFAHFYEGQPPEIRARAPAPGPDFWFLDPSCILERACAADPHREAFERWLAWERGPDEHHTKSADRVAAAWHAALPGDAAPLLYLASSAEERDALTQAIAHLEKAERLDALNPAVRRARFRLLVATALRHAKQRKAHLLADDLQALDALAEAREGFRPALVLALGWLEASVRGDAPATGSRARLVAERLGSESGATFFLEALGRAAGVPRPAIPARLTDDMVRGLGRASLVAAEARLAIEIPRRFDRPIAKALDKKNADLDAAELQALGEALLAKERLAPAYAVSGAGLRLGGATTARFLLLRARSLPDFSQARRRDACAAAAELARRQRDNELVKAAVDAARSHDRRGYGDREDARESVLEPAALERILERERRERTIPRVPTFEDSEPCTCPACRDPFAFEDGDFEDDDFEDDGFEDDLGDGAGGAFGSLDLDELDLGVLGGLARGIPPEALPILLELVKKHGRPGGSIPPIEKIEREDPALVKRLLDVVAKSGVASPFGPRRRRR